VAGAFALLIFQFKGPVAVPESNLAVTLAPGASGWGSGDETIRLTHNGGEALDADLVTVAYSINGATTALTGASGLGGAFADGKFTIGEVWTWTVRMAGSDTVKVNVVSRGETGVLLTSSTLVPAQLPSGTQCPFDTVAPTVLSWTLTPSDLATTSSGAVTVRGLATDNCKGVDDGAAVQLFWCLTLAPPCASGSMTSATTTLASTNAWQATVPAQPWASRAGYTLEFELRNLRDLGGNAGSSARGTEFVDLITTRTYVTGKTDATGTTAGFANAQSATDAGAVATLTEGAAPATTSLAANNQVSAGAGWGGGSNTFVSDNSYASNGNNNPGALRLGFPNPAAGGPISAVRITMEQSITSFADDTWSVQACFAGGACGTAPAAQAGTAADTTLTFDVTGLRPGGGPWTWTDINNLEASIQPNRVGAGRDGTWRVDRVAVDVVHTGNGMSIQFDWTGVPAGAIGAQGLELSYSTTGDTYTVQVWDWGTSAWTPRGSALTSGTLAPWTYTLASSEYSAGSGLVRIRFVDATPAGGTAGTLDIEYARVSTT
jgi:hypothetical protein